MSPGKLKTASRAQSSLEPLRCTLVSISMFPFSAVHGLFALVCLALGFTQRLSQAPRLSRPSTATKPCFVLLRFRNSKVAIDARNFNEAPFALQPSMALRLRLAPRAVALENFGVHFTLSNLARSFCSVVSSMNCGLGWLPRSCLSSSAGGVPCRGQRNQGSLHSQVHCFVGRETCHDPLPKRRGQGI